ncbi:MULTISPECIES: hypothetical protein [Christiangramia]|uniref:Uncharacterized protein n=1 Tax=Gramella jeungdoensis TaxID=708091 RepID=A0ABT0Z448_9FLAO|nr:MULTISPECIES: hypothetical protein [Christiangramia]MCM8570512.1 hypothetical protein [Gramella jeungdoensis]
MSSLILWYLPFVIKLSPKFGSEENIRRYPPAIKPNDRMKNINDLFT